MRYDIEALHTFQDVLEFIKKSETYGQAGICAEIGWFNFDRHHELGDWMHHKYMPDKGRENYWWPKSSNYSDEVLERARQDRIEFLERIIEDLMCGE